MIGPGFVDLQVNGFLGVDFSRPELTAEEVRGVARELRLRGTVAFCPTVITSDEAVYASNLPVLADAAEDPELAPMIPGIHLEGPFISPVDGARGAHPAAHVRPPDIAFFDRLLDRARGHVRLVTLAPEMPGAEALIRRAVKAGCRVALGHHLASAREIERACAAGATLVTHFGNGLPNSLPRHPNPLWDQLAEERLDISIIPDGHHLPPSVIRVVVRLRGADRVLAVSDSAPIAGFPPGRYNTLGQEVVLEETGHLWNPVENHLVGSSLCMLDCMNVLASLGILGGEDLWKVGLHNPLRLLGRSLEDLADGGPAVRFREGRFLVE
jgi:N-acetylglucosamine-6-phosphate deacetylase